MALTLASPITDLQGIGPARAKSLERLNIRHIRDFLFYFPKKYEDYSVITPIAKLEIGKQTTVCGNVISVQSKNGFFGKRKIFRIYVDIDDGTSVLHVTWFNLRFLEQKLAIGTQIYVAGEVEAARFQTGIHAGVREFAMRSPSLEFAASASERIHTAAITPVYSETAGISSRFIRYQVKNLLPAIQQIPEYLPEEVLVRNNLIGIHRAITAVHFPSSQEELLQAKRRLEFDELFFLQLASLVRRRHLQKSVAYSVTVLDEVLAPHIERIGFALTGAQKRVIEEIRSDMQHAHPMNRLLQGDVGSGKSAVAFIAGQMTLLAGKKVLYAAPTEILARQQFNAFSTYIVVSEVRLLIGSTSKREKKEIAALLQSDAPCCIIGTHALLQEAVSATNVGLAIIDEQHRFGVAQRKALLSVEEGIVPHLLSMTATPIPRTLSLTVYGDLDVSVLDELPAGRQVIQTHVLSPEDKDAAIIYMLEELHKGRQAYIITPRIEDSKQSVAKSAIAAYSEITKLFPGIAVGLLHGQMNSAEKETVMNNFDAGALQLLVATAVVEVGVNIPNATVMMIEGAERFGLAQLHQFRGRIGRGAYASVCYVVPTTVEQQASERLQIFAQTYDGFKIAEEDLRMRGPGEAYGSMQSGFGNLKVASLLDYKMISLVRKEAEKILRDDPELQHHIILRKKVEQKNSLAHFE